LWIYLAKELAKLTGFILVTIGFLGFIIKDFVIDLGRVVTIVFAVINAVGLATLAFTHWGMNRQNTDRV